jgi:hypothetical protein
VDGKRGASASPPIVPVPTVTNTTATPTPTGGSGGSSVKIENVIRSLGEFGFDRASCMKALEKLGYLNSSDNFVEDVILQSVINYMMR